MKKNLHILYRKENKVKGERRASWRKKFAKCSHPIFMTVANFPMRTIGADGAAPARLRVLIGANAPSGTKRRRVALVYLARPN